MSSNPIPDEIVELINCLSLKLKDTSSKKVLINKLETSSIEEVLLHIKYIKKLEKQRVRNNRYYNKKKLIKTVSTQFVNEIIKNAVDGIVNEIANKSS
jgi:hypothetical protein